MRVCACQSCVMHSQVRRTSASVAAVITQLDTAMAHLTQDGQPAAGPSPSAAAGGAASAPAGSASGGGGGKGAEGGGSSRARDRAADLAQVGRGYKGEWRTCVRG